MKKRIVVWMMLVLVLVLAGCASAETPAETIGVTGAGPERLDWIFLYGEDHGEADILEKEGELWQQHYEEDGMRHLFLEMGYCSAQVLNLWMVAEDDTLLEMWYANVAGTQAGVPETLELYRSIKAHCPETVFHGTDVEHQDQSTGQWYLAYLEEQGLGDTEEYALAQEMMEQARIYYEMGQDSEYREQCMTENFAREFESLAGESVMGIYGLDHVARESASVMGRYLAERYPGQVLSWSVAKLAIQDRNETQTVSVDGKDYEALYCGGQEDNGVSRKYWLVEGQREDFYGWKIASEAVLSGEMPMLVGPDAIVVVEETGVDGSVEQKVYWCDGEMEGTELVFRRIFKAK